MSKSNRKEYSLYLEQQLVEKFDNMIFPLKRSNVIHALILEYLIKNAENLPTGSAAKQHQSGKIGDASY